MAKYLDVIGLQTLWAKIKSFVGAFIYVSTNGQEVTLYNKNNNNSGAVRVSTSNVIIGALPTTTEGGANDPIKEKYFDANGTYTQVSHGDTCGITIKDDEVRVNGKVVFGSDNVNFKNSTKDTDMFIYNIDADTLSSLRLRKIECKKLFNIDDEYVMISIKLFGSDSTALYRLIETDYDRIIATFPPIQILSASGPSTMLCVPLPKDGTSLTDLTIDMV